MYKKIFVFTNVLMFCFGCKAEILSLNDALRSTYTACVGIDEQLSDLKKMAGINTVVTAVGTGLGLGAVATGVAKAKTDEILAQKYKEMAELSYSASSVVETMDEDDFLNSVRIALNNSNITNNHINTDNHQAEIDKLEEKSKKLGNWRTGLLIGNTVTNVAGTVIANTNKVNKTLSEQIDDCKLSVRKLEDAIIQAKLNGEDVSEATQIQSVCSGFEYIDINKINKRATGAMVSSAVGAGTGVVGTITSALANSQNVREDNSIKGQQKEKNLNIASDVLAGASTVSSASATIFNATQIKAIKDVVNVAEQCSEVLK